MTTASRRWWPPSFGDIFQTNAGKNRIITVQLPHAEVEELVRLIDDDPRREITIHLVDRTISTGGWKATFALDEHVRHRLIEGLDDVDLTLWHETAIAAFERGRAAFLPRTTRGTHRPPTARTEDLRPMGLVELLLLGRAHDAVDLATGTPSLPPTPPAFVDAAWAAMREGRNRYDNPAGNVDLRRQAAAQHDADPNAEITVTVGATEGLTVVLQSLLDPGDEVVVIQSGYEPYPAGVRLAGGMPRFVTLHRPPWTWDPEQLAAAFNSRTRAIIVNSPHNPTGRVFTPAELAELAAHCERWDAVVVSDEVYTEHVPDPAAVLPPSRFDALAGRVVTLRSLSRVCGISGWRIGWICGPARLTAVFRLVHETFTAGASAPLQVAAAAAMKEVPGLSTSDRRLLIANRDRLRACLTDLGQRCPEPEGGCYLFAEMPDGNRLASASVAITLITDVGVTCAPGSLFYSRGDEGDRLLRFSFNKSAADVTNGIRKLSGSAQLHNMSPS